MKWKDILKNRAGRKDPYSFTEYGSTTRMPYIGPKKTTGRIYSGAREPLSPERQQQANEKRKETIKRKEEQRLREEKEKREARYTGGQFLDKPEKEEATEPTNPFRMKRD